MSMANDTWTCGTSDPNAFIAALLAPLPEGVEPVETEIFLRETKAFQREIQAQMKWRWFSQRLLTEAARHEREAASFRDTWARYHRGVDRTGPRIHDHRRCGWG